MNGLPAIEEDGHGTERQISVAESQGCWKES
jgi:hypothetical protein